MTEVGLTDDTARSWTLRVLPGRYCVARGAADATAPAAAEEGFFSVTRTLDETSVVCAEDAAPDGWTVKPGWRILQVAGVLDFSEIGILAALSTTLAEAGVSIFAMSTWDTDYLMVAERDLERTRSALRQAGHEVVDSV